MALVPITITNTNKWGKPTNKWYVKIGKRFRVFNRQDWERDGLAWVNAQHAEAALEGTK